MLRYADFRLDGSSLQILADGSAKVTGQLTHPGLFSYRNSDGTERKEYRPADEVFKKAALETFASAPVTINHPRTPDGQRLVTAQSWKSVAIGHLGENVREDGGHVVADLYIRDAAAVERVKRGDLKHISCGYSVDYDPTPGVTEDGKRYDGVQRNIRGNHVALLPTGVAPRGGQECSLRLDSAGDEVVERLHLDVDIDALTSQVTALTSELAKARTDAAEVETLKSKLATAEKALADAQALVAPERLDALVEERSAVVAAAKAVGVETAGKSNLAIKRLMIAKRTPDLAARVDAMSDETADSILAVYKTEAHPSLALPALAVPARTDATESAAKKLPTIAEMTAKHAEASRNAWKNTGDDVAVKGN